MNCPICGKPVAFTDPFLPFCGERCQLLDLANWATGKYAIPAGAIERTEDNDE